MRNKESLGQLFPCNLTLGSAPGSRAVPGISFGEGDSGPCPAAKGNVTPPGFMCQLSLYQPFPGYLPTHYYPISCHVFPLDCHQPTLPLCQQAALGPAPTQTRLSFHPTLCTISSPAWPPPLFLGPRTPAFNKIRATKGPSRSVCTARVRPELPGAPRPSRTHFPSSLVFCQSLLSLTLPSLPPRSAHRRAFVEGARGVQTPGLRRTTKTTPGLQRRMSH